MSVKELVGSATDTGQVREENQDSVSFFQTGDGVWTILIVCDGMGGHAGGAQASAMAAESIGREFTDRVVRATPVDALRESVKAANRSIVEFAKENTELRGMGTTCVVLAVARDEAYVANVGDSRAYRVRPGSVEQVTTDHSYVQRMIDSGILTPEQAEAHPDANMLLRCLGSKSDIEVDVIGPESVLPGDRYILCSDGLWGQVNPAEIAAMATAFPAKDAVFRLINLANERGGPDNISVQIYHQSDAHPSTGAFSPEKFIIKKFVEKSQHSETAHTQLQSSKGLKKSKVIALGLIAAAVLGLVAIALFLYKKNTDASPGTTKATVVEAEVPATKKSTDETGPAVAAEKSGDDNEKAIDAPAVEKTEKPAEAISDSDSRSNSSQSKTPPAKEKK